MYYVLISKSIHLYLNFISKYCISIYRVCSKSSYSINFNNFQATNAVNRFVISICK